MQQLDLGQVSLLDRVKRILLNLMYLLGQWLGGLDITYLQEMMNQFFEGWSTCLALAA